MNRYLESMLSGNFSIHSSEGCNNGLGRVEALGHAATIARDDGPELLCSPAQVVVHDQIIVVPELRYLPRRYSQPLLDDVSLVHAAVLQTLP